MNILIWSKHSLATLAALLAVASAQEEFTLEFLQLDTLDSTPAEIMISPNYQTLIEFEGMQIGQPSSGRVDLITLEREPDTVRVRANEPVVNTDLVVPVGGTVAMFSLAVDEDATAPKRYVVRRPREQQIRSDQTEGTAASILRDLARQGKRPEVLPQGVTFDAQLLFLTDRQVVIQYALANTGDFPITAETQRLSLTHEGEPVPRTISRIAPDDGLARIQTGEGEYGTIVVNNPPEGPLLLEWPITEIGPGTTYYIRREYREGLTRAVQ